MVFNILGNYDNPPPKKHKKKQEVKKNIKNSYIFYNMFQCLAGTSHPCLNSIQLC